MEIQIQGASKRVRKSIITRTRRARVPFITVRDGGKLKERSLGLEPIDETHLTVDDGPGRVGDQGRAAADGSRSGLGRSLTGSNRSSTGSGRFPPVLFGT